MSHILVVHPHESYARPVLQTLAALGYAAEHVPTGREAVEHVADDGVRGVFFAESLPDMDGTDCFLKLRRAQPGLRGVLMSADATVNTVFAAMWVGVSKVLREPVDPSDVLPALVSMTGGAAPRLKTA